MVLSCKNVAKYGTLLQKYAKYGTLLQKCIFLTLNLYPMENEELITQEIPQEGESNLQHIQIPNNLLQTKDITPIDALVYLALRSFDGKDGCYPSIKTIADKAQVSTKVVKKTIKKLINDNWIEAKCAGRGHYTYYTFLKDNPFEPFSYEFLNTKDISPMTKGYLICSQHDMFKNSSTEGAMSKTAMNISEDINMPLRTVYACEKELKDKNILTVVKAKRSKDIGFCPQEVRLYDFSKYFQAIAYILRHQQEQIDKNTQDIQEIKKIIELKVDTAHNRQFEKEVQYVLASLCKKVKELESKR